jgi:hypothetical protein
MGKKQFAKDPLLYIHQPSISTPEAPMQSDYRSPSNNTQQNTTSRTNPETITPLNARSNKQVPTQKAQKQPVRKTAFEKQFSKTREEDTGKQVEQDDTDASSASEDTSDTNETVKFNDRSVKEKVAYFVDAPDFAPKMRCEIKTDARTYRGYIVDQQENIVYLRTGKRTTNTKVPLEEIINIRMLGF